MDRLVAAVSLVVGPPLPATLSYETAFVKLLGDPVHGHMLWDGPESDAFRRVTEVQGEMRAMSLTDASGGSWCL
jgi:predicted phage gp36 major capsid-like protein